MSKLIAINDKNEQLTSVMAMSRSCHKKENLLSYNHLTPDKNQLNDAIGWTLL